MNWGGEEDGPRLAHSCRPRVQGADRRPPHHHIRTPCQLHASVNPRPGSQQRQLPANAAPLRRLVRPVINGQYSRAGHGGSTPCNQVVPQISGQRLCTSPVRAPLCHSAQTAASLCTAGLQGAVANRTRCGLFDNAQPASRRLATGAAPRSPRLTPPACSSQPASCVMLYNPKLKHKLCSPLSLSNSTDTPAVLGAGDAGASGAAADSSTMRRLRVRLPLLPLP